MPSGLSSIVGTSESGARSETVEWSLWKGGRPVLILGGEEDSIAVEEVGTGVGYVTSSLRTSRLRFRGLGSAGDENGSKAGSREATGRLLPATGESLTDFPSKLRAMFRSLW